MTAGAGLRSMARIDFPRARDGDFHAHRYRAGAPGHAGGEPAPAFQQCGGGARCRRPVVQAQLRHLQLEADTGGYEAAAAADDRIEAIYDSIARLLNADRAEIALVENATVAWDMAFYSVGFAAGDRILTAEAEYASNYIAFLQVARRTGAVVDVVPSDEAGELDRRARSSA